ncbi:N-acetyltransferase family protein [Streptomyces sp. SudanB52_2052]|uniref:GNAT family N-acetyltransferase n=1 Tax=Streptomyces sp. SudanB52_2052 TaxID=3035276 RepID=UPI003F56A3E7
MEIRTSSPMRVRAAHVADWQALNAIDSTAAAGDDARSAHIRRWLEQGSVLVAEDPSGIVGYSVLEYTFFEQGFITMLMVSPNARRRGIGAHLLQAAEAACSAPKLFTSTNVSNHPNCNRSEAGTDSTPAARMPTCSTGCCLVAAVDVPDRPVGRGVVIRCLGGADDAACREQDKLPWRWLFSKRTEGGTSRATDGAASGTPTDRDCGQCHAGLMTFLRRWP